jgi:hypothetical protein
MTAPRFPIEDYLRERWILCQMSQSLRHGMSFRHRELGYLELSANSQESSRSAYLKAARIQFLLGLNSDEMERII